MTDEVENSDFKKQFSAAKDDFVWMAEYGKLGTKTTLFHKTDSDWLVWWLEVWRVLGWDCLQLAKFWRGM